ncbi:UBX domain-containing protein 11 isoform X2 [Antennarius striatus]|uniref:UBX domain-containing protein 11 isoform X2 n=1 Tax=Antennarius striatus TaxID=241820 RepID=UPI0035B3C10C
MSSPLTLLKKTKRTPLQDPLRERREGQKVSFRRNLLKELPDGCSDDDDESSHAAASPAAPAKAKAHSRKDDAPNDFELMSAMMTRVCLLERTVRSQAREIECKDNRIQVLEEKLRRKKQQEGSHDLIIRDDLDERCQRLQNQVCEMESFLNDYGLIWVGNGDSSDSTGTTPDVERGSKQSDTAAVGNFRMNFDLVLQRIKDLNAGEGECFVQSTCTGAQLAKKNPVHLSLYSNGIVIFDGPFRSYQEHSTQQCMQDLMDGYFPTELQETFPDGVPFEVYDRRDEEFILRSPCNKFPGEGRVVGGKKNETARKLKVDQFLNKLPKGVFEAGGVTDIRDSLTHVLKGSSAGQSSSSVEPIETAAMKRMKQRLQTNSSDRPASAHSVINLKVKSEDRKQTFTLKMYLSETIGHLRQYVDKHRRGSLSPYDIISAHPQCSYHEDSQTLQSCGLTADSTLLLRKKKPPLFTEGNKMNL